MLAIGGIATGSGGGGASYTDEQVRDTIGAALVAGSNVSIVVDDAGDTITISATAAAGYTDEQAQDAFASLIAAGTHSGIAFTYNDAGNAISATVSAQTWSQITGKPTFATVATSGSYSDLANQPAITPPTRQITAGTGLTGGGDLTADRSLAVAYGTTSGTAAQGNDTRLSDQRTPTDGSVTDAKVAAGAAIAESKLLLASDAAAGTASRRSLGTGGTQAAAGNDARFTDNRTPLDASVTDAKVASGAAIAESKLNLASDAVAGVASRRTLGTGAQQAAAGNDPRFTDARTPTTHASTHAVGGSDPVSPASIGAPIATVPTGSKTANYTAVSGELVMVDATSGAITVTLPAAAAGRLVGVKKTDSSSNVVTVARAGSDTIGSDLATSVPIRINDQVTYFQASGTNWVIPYNHLSLLALDGRYERVVARGSRTTSTAASAGATASRAFGIPAVSVLAGRLYRVSLLQAVLSGSAANGFGQANIVYTTDGSEPTTSSTILVGATIPLPLASGGYSVHPVVGHYVPGADGTLRPTVTYNGHSGNNVTFIANGTASLVVEDLGVAPAAAQTVY